MPGVKFLWTTPKFGLRQKNTSSGDYVLQTMSYMEILCRGHARTVKKCTKKSAEQDEFVVLLSKPIAF